MKTYNKWQKIKTCPVDTDVLFLIEGIPYAGMATPNSIDKTKINYLWRMHTDISTEPHPNYQPRLLGYKSGMNSTPSYWLPLIKELED